jgi:Ca2+-binding RTX toxin-like protein
MPRFLAPILSVAVGSFFGLTSLAGPASADSSAATVQVVSGQLEFMAAYGQTDHVFLNVGSSAGSYLVSDDAAGGITAGAGCSMKDSTTVKCAGPISLASVRLLDGNDSFSYGNPSIGGVPTDVFGGRGDDTISTEVGPDYLNGGAGNDLLEGFGGGDMYVGGGGVDTVSYDGATEFRNGTDGVTVTTDGAANDGFPGDDDNVEADVENVTGTAYDDTITGNAGVLEGEGGNDSLTLTTGGGAEYGSIGNDSLHAGPVFTLLSGGLGNDTLFSADNVKDRDNCGNGSADTVTADAHDVIANCEIVHLTP